MPKPPKTALETAAASLARRACTKAELRRRLFKKEKFTAKEIFDAIAELERMGYLSDRRYAEDFVLVMRQKGYGDRCIRSKMMLKGLDRELIDEILNVPDDHQSPFECAMELLEKRRRRLEQTDDPQKLARQILNLLARRGFSADVSYKALSAWKEAHK